jgi:K+ transporter
VIITLSADNHGEGGICFICLNKKDKIKWLTSAIIGGSALLQTKPLLLLSGFSQQWKN